MKNNLLFAIIATSISFNLYAQTGPAGVGNNTTNKLWFDAYQLNLSNGTAVSTFTDFSGNGNNATQSTPANRPTFLTNQANGMPALSFDGSNDYLETGSIPDLETNNITWFVVGKVAAVHTGVFLRNAYSSGAGVGSAQMWGNYIHSSSGQYTSHVRRSNSNFVGGTIGFNSTFNFLTSVWNGSSSSFSRYFNGSLIGTSSLANAVPSGHLRTRIGADSPTSPSFFLNGNVAEVIAYTQVLNTTQRIIIENYLGNKYGITFTNDMYAYQNTHQYEIAGIGQTSPSDNHLTSQGSSIIEISNPSSINNNSFMFWGHDNSSMAAQVGDVPVGYGTRLTRNWRIGKSGSIGAVTVRIDISSIGWADPTTYALLIDTDGTFSDATAHTTGLSFDGIYLTFTNVNLNDGDYITLASTSASIDIISITTGNWENASTWNCGCVPGTGANVTIDNGHTVTLNSNVSVNDFTINPSGTFTVNGSHQLTLNGNFTLDGTFNCGTGTVIYAGSNPQTITAANYYNLTSTNTGTRTLASSGTIGIAGTFTPGTNSYTITGSTIEFNGSSSQTIPAFNYHNLTSSNTGTRVLANSGTIGIAGTFTPGSNSYTITGSTINFNGSSTQTIPAFNYNNLTSSNTGTRILANSGTIGIAGAFTRGTNTYTTTGSTIEFNGSGSQNIPSFNYFNLTSSNTGPRSIASQIINIAGTFTPGSNTYTVNNSVVNFNGNSAQTIPPFTYFDLRTSGSGTKTFDSSNSINILRDLTFQSTASIVANNSNIVFNGSVNQTITSPNSTTLELYDLTINKSAGGVFLGNTTNAIYRLRGALTISSATNFNTNNRTFILVSDATSTARIAPVLNGGSITGNFTMQRFISSGSNGWRTMGAPGNTTVADWDNELLLSGVGGGEGFFPGPPFYSMYRYVEGTGYSFISTTSHTLTPGSGVEVWICGPTYEDTGTFSNITLNTIANPYIGNLNINVFNTGDGNNLVANPFASHIDLDLITGGDIEKTFYIFDEDIGSPDYYAYWDSDGQEGTGDLASSNGIIPPHQGFWVFANTTSTITIPESAKTTTSTSSFVGKQELPELSVRINKQNSPKGSRAFIRFNDVSTKNFDEYDKQFRLPVPPNIPSISILTEDNKKLIVNSLNEYENSYTFPLSVKSGTEGLYQLSVDRKNITNGYNCFKIEDTKLNKITDVSNGAYYEVVLNNNEKIDNRFILHISKDNCPTSENPSGIYSSAIENKVGVFGHEQGAVVIFGYNETVKANISVYNTLGQLISQPLSQNISNDRVIINLPATTQVYIIKVEVNGEVLTQRIVR